MICSLYQLKNSLKEKPFIRIIGSEEVELQLYIDRLGLAADTIKASSGPWGSFILTWNSQNIALGPNFAKKLQVESI